MALSFECLLVVASFTGTLETLHVLQYWYTDDYWKECWYNRGSKAKYWTQMLAKKMLRSRKAGVKQQLKQAMPLLRTCRDLWATATATATASWPKSWDEFIEESLVYQVHLGVVPVFHGELWESYGRDVCREICWSRSPDAAFSQFERQGIVFCRCGDLIKAQGPLQPVHRFQHWLPLPSICEMCWVTFHSSVCMRKHIEKYHCIS